MSDQAFQTLSLILYRSAHNLERFDNALGLPTSEDDVFQRFLTLTQFSLVELATDDIVGQMEETLSLIKGV